MPLAIDLFCGLGGWTDGLLAEGYDVIGFDIERHQYGEHRYPAQLVVQDILTLHGSQLRTADLIVASPPCQRYSYMAMPWSRAKAQIVAIKADTTGQSLANLNRLFDACFRIQREACEAAGRHIPLIVENVQGAQPWVGRARWNFGSFYLWGDVPALMPVTLGRVVMKRGVAHRSDGATNFHGHKNDGGSWFAIGSPGQKVTGQNPDGRKQGGTWWHDEGSISRTTGSKSPACKMASAMIAKIPLPLARHIARVYQPRHQNAAGLDPDGAPLQSLCAAIADCEPRSHP